MKMIWFRAIFGSNFTVADSALDLTSVDSTNSPDGVLDASADAVSQRHIPVSRHYSK